MIDNFYLIDERGKIVISHDPAAMGRSVADRDYFRFYQTAPGDRIFVGSVESGRVTGKFHFRVVRPISNPDGTFAGVVLGTVNPESFTNYYRTLAVGEQNTATLLGSIDKKLRARVPEPDSDRWQAPVVSPLWEALELSPTGNYLNTSSVDSVRRLFVYKKIDNLPLVMTTGFSEADVRVSVHERMRWPIVGTALVLGIVLILAGLLTVEIRRRSEQGNFMAMLSHELKTPLSVMRMALSAERSLTDRTRSHALQAVQDMDAIIYRCLQVDRLRQRGEPIARQPCQLSELLADLQAAAASTAPQRLQIVADNLPTIRTDPQLLSIALNNLIYNALSYSPPQSTVALSAQCHRDRRCSGILICIGNAVGKAGAPDARQVFKKYYRGPGSHHVTGSGLGLHLVHTVARLLGGWIRYAPAEGEVRFELWLPL